MTGDRLALGAVGLLALAGAVRGRGSRSSSSGQLQRLALQEAEFFAPQALRGIDLFAGAGGFTIGALCRGCRVVGVQRAPRAAQTGRRAGHRVAQLDAAEAARRTPGLRMDVLIGGPPCQPYSPAGKRLGRYDPRDGFGIALEAIDAWRPQRVVLENVEEFLSDRHVEIRRALLAGLHARFRHVGAWRLNAVDYGVPQNRVRVFLWGAETPLEPPPPTHGPGTGRPAVPVGQALPGLLDEGFDALLAFQGGARSRTTARPSPTVTTRRNLYAVRGRDLVYRGAGSVPARRRRLLTPEEVQVLQAFPPTFGFVGTQAERATQNGNAVPPPLAAAVVAATTAGLRPRKTTPTELLDSFGRLESMWVLEPRPWTDAALIGVTTLAPQAPGQLVAVYDASGYKHAVMDAAAQNLAEQRGISRQQVWADDVLNQEAFNQGSGWLSAQKDLSVNERPILVPSRTLKALGLPAATVLLSEDEQNEALWGAMNADPEFREATRGLSREEADDVVHQWLHDTLAEHQEVWAA